MKILAVGDVHGNKNIAKELSIKAIDENVDLIVISGDITFQDNDPQHVIGYFKNTGKKILIIPGNHDSFSTVDFLAAKYEIKNIHGYAVKYDDVGVFACGGSNIGFSRLSEDDIFRYLSVGHEKIKYLDKKIMVTHNHPKDTIMEQFSNFVIGSEGVKNACLEFNPDILICSHVHEAEGIEEKIGNTKVINVGKRGRIIEI